MEIKPIPSVYCLFCQIPSILWFGQSTTAYCSPYDFLHSDSAHNSTCIFHSTILLKIPPNDSSNNILTLNLTSLLTTILFLYTSPHGFQFLLGTTCRTIIILTYLSLPYFFLPVLTFFLVISFYPIFIVSLILFSIFNISLILFYCCCTI